MLPVVQKDCCLMGAEIEADIPTQTDEMEKFPNAEMFASLMKLQNEDLWSHEELAIIITQVDSDGLVSCWRHCFYRC